MTEIKLNFDNLTVLFTLLAVYAASIAVITSAIIHSLGWKRPYNGRREKILQWGPALASAVVGAVAAPFVYSIVVTDVSGWQWHAAGAPVGFLAGLLSKPAYYLLKKRLAPAIIDGSEAGFKGGGNGV